MDEDTWEIDMTIHPDTGPLANVTASDVLAYGLGQPDEQYVGVRGSACGCLIAQYAQEVLGTRVSVTPWPDGDEPPVYAHGSKAYALRADLAALGQCFDTILALDLWNRINAGQLRTHEAGIRRAIKEVE